MPTTFICAVSRYMPSGMQKRTNKLYHCSGRPSISNPEFGLAYMRAAACIFQRPGYGGPALTDRERSEVIQLNDRALALEPADAFVVAWASVVIAFASGDIERGSDYADRALTINPNLSNAWNARGWISLCIGEGERSLEAFDHAIRLNRTTLRNRERCLTSGVAQDRGPSQIWSEAAPSQGHSETIVPIFIDRGAP